MPVAFQSISDIYQASGVGSSVAVPKPAGLAVSDMMLAMGWLSSGQASSIILPAGWIKIREDEPASGTGNPLGFLAFKFADAADVAASTFIFNHTEGSSQAWNVAIYRISGAGGIDNDRILFINNIPGTSFLLPALDILTNNVLLVRGGGGFMTGNEPTSFTDPGTDTRQAANGGPFDPGAGDPFGWWGTFGIVATPQTIVSATVTMVGVTGNQRTVQYAVGIFPALGSGGTMDMLLDEKGEALNKGQKILNPFGTKKRACMCPVGKCRCL